MELLGGGGMLRNLYVTVCVLEMTVGPKSLFCVLIVCPDMFCPLLPADTPKRHLRTELPCDHKREPLKLFLFISQCHQVTCYRHSKFSNPLG